MRWAAAIVVLAIVGCGDGSTAPPIAFPGAVSTIADGREIAVVGFLVDDGSVVRVCEALAESSPPMCGGAAAVIVGLDTSQVAGISGQGEVRWTDFPIELLGETSGGTLRYIRHVRLSG